MRVKSILGTIPLSILLFAFVTSKAQISHGGKPLPYLELRSYQESFFQTMPSFDVEAEKRIDSLNQQGFKGDFRFAYKFISDFTRANSGTSFTLADGTKIWRLGIRSENAYSINVLFTEYELPEGARLFLYSPDQGQVLGSFTHLNNSELGLLPVAPVDGDELIIEYQEPADVAFAGRLKIGEVNHGYRDLRGPEPGKELADFYCMPSPVCFSDTTKRYDNIVRSVVLLIINGERLCTGGLINNTANDGTPYLLTASHCLNGQFSEKNPDYAAIAGTIVSFFHYESPFCANVIRGNQELSMASALFRAVNEKTDMALLELMEKPPVYYRPYYAGWNSTGTNAPPYANIHHPGGSVKRINNSTKQISLVSFSDKLFSPFRFNSNSFWFVDEWTTGSTAGGSSGSPLFDSNYRIIGALTGGESTCAQPKVDLFFALHKSWTAGNTDNTNLQPWLAPGGNAPQQCDGLDPYDGQGAVKVSNIPTDGSRESAVEAYLPAPQSGQQFGVNTLGITEYAEKYEVESDALLYGVYLVTPTAQNRTALKVDINVYASSEDAAPAEVLATTSFSPTYTNVSILDGSFLETNKPLSRPQESFIKFDTPVGVSRHFFVGYKITAFEKDSFTVYSLPRNLAPKNTAWLKHDEKWIENTAHPSNPYKTSLFMSPVLCDGNGIVSVEKNPLPELILIADRASGSITVILPEGNERTKYNVYSIDGRLVQSGHLTKDRDVFYIQEKGLFIIKLISERNSQVSKFIL